VQFVKPNVLHRPGLSVGEDHGFADQLALGLLECAEDRGRADLRSRHGEPGIRCEAGRCLQLKGAKVVTGARQTGVKTAILRRLQAILEGETAATLPVLREAAKWVRFP
jgi:hypothetical protein